MKNITWGNGKRAHKPFMKSLMTSLMGHNEFFGCFSFYYIVFVFAREYKTHIGVVCLVQNWLFIFGVNGTLA